MAGLSAQGLGRLTIQNKLRTHLGPALIVALALAVLGIGIWSGGPAPTGADSYGHLFRAEQLARAIQEDGWAGYLRTAWMPAWYMGDPFRTYYPPLAVDLLGPLVYWVGDPFLAVRIFNTLLLLALGAITYGCLGTFLSPWQAGLGTVLSLIAPFQVRTIFLEGNFNRSLSLLALPVVAALTEKILAPSGRKGPLTAALAGVWCLTILAHPQQALIYGAGFGLYILARLFFDPDLPMRRAAVWMIAIVAGALLSAAWTLPAYSRGELPNIPYQPAEMAEIYSLHLSALLPALDMHDHVILGTGTLLLALLAAAARPEPRRSALTLAGLLALWLSFGNKGVLYTLLPLNQQLLPERFVNFSAFAFSLAACGLLPMGKSARWARGFVIVGLLGLDFLPSAQAPIGKDVPLSIESTRAALEAHVGEVGRTALFTYPEPGSANVYYAAQATDQIFGWTLQNTPHHLAIRRVLGAPKWGPAYLEHLLSLWDVRWAVVGGPGIDSDPARSALESAGFTVEASGEFETWGRPATQSPVQVLPSNRMLVLGDRLPPLLAVFPFAEESSSLTLGSLPAGVLESYPVVGMFRFESSQAGLDAEVERLRAYVEGGGQVVLDLSGMEDLVGRTLDYLGVDVLRVSFADPMVIRWDPELTGLPGALPLADVSPEGWSGAAYQGLDHVLAEVQYQGEWWPILGYKDFGQGRAWFIGLNLLYYSQITDGILGSRLADLVLQGTDVYRDLEYPKLAVSEWRPSGTAVDFTVDVGASPQDVLVSYTYSPRWRASVDGQPWDLGQFEHLISMHLPAGLHSVSIAYDAYGTPWPKLGLGVSLLAVAGMVAGLWVERRRYLPIPGAPAAKPQAVPEYAPCANCGFRLAEVGPPSAVTYPFQVVHCPICGMSMDDDGFQPGQTLDEDGRQRALGDWLRLNRYDPEVVHTKWGFAVKEFFAAVPVPSTPTEAEPGEAGKRVE